MLYFKRKQTQSKKKINKSGYIILKNKFNPIKSFHYISFPLKKEKHTIPNYAKVSLESCTRFFFFRNRNSKKTRKIKTVSKLIHEGLLNCSEFHFSGSQELNNRNFFK